MKHIKRFNEAKQDDYHLQVVKDVFQDIIDDYDIEYSNFDYTMAGIYYNIKKYIDNKCDFYIWRNNRVSEISDLTDEEKNIIPIIRKNMSRLDALGYTTALEFSDPFIKVVIVW